MKTFGLAFLILNLALGLVLSSDLLSKMLTKNETKAIYVIMEEPLDEVSYPSMASVGT